MTDRRLYMQSNIRRSLSVFFVFTTILSASTLLAAQAPIESLRVVFDKIRVIDDSDDIGKGEMIFLFQIGSLQPGAQIRVPNKFSEEKMYGGGRGSYKWGSGETHGIGVVLGISRPTNSLLVEVGGADDDRFTGSVPNSSTSLETRHSGGDDHLGFATGTFDLTKFSGQKVSVPFSVITAGADSLKFEVSGRIEFTRMPSYSAFKNPKPVDVTPKSEQTQPAPQRPIRQMGKGKAKAADQPADEPRPVKSMGKKTPPWITAKQNADGTTTISWDGGGAHPYAEIWVKVDDTDEIFVVEQGKGTRTISGEKGRRYLYILTDAGQRLATTSITF